MNESSGAVCAVIVTYHPDAATLQASLQALHGQVGAAVVVDNTETGATHEATMFADARDVIRPSGNIGLAAAQNLGIDWAREHGYRYVLILDQDSVAGPGMVDALLLAMASVDAGQRIAAVGPRFHDVHEGRDAPFVRIGFPFNRKLWCREGQAPVAVDFLISSGSLIPLHVLDDVGAMDAELFIDSVDLEWSFRARAQGYMLYGVCAATMHHSLGDSRKPLPLLPRGIVVHGAQRLYYMMRNRVLLYRRRHTPGIWIAQDLPRLLVKLFLFGVVVAPRGRNLRCMLKGLWDGCRGRTGRMPS